MTREILAVTGIRSDYDVIFSALSSIHTHDDLSLRVVATGAHVADSHGDTISYIERDGFEVVDSIAYLLRGDDKRMRSKGVGTLVS